MIALAEWCHRREIAHPIKGIYVNNLAELGVSVSPSVNPPPHATFTGIPVFVTKFFPVGKAGIMDANDLLFMVDIGAIP